MLLVVKRRVDKMSLVEGEVSLQAWIFKNTCGVWYFFTLQGTSA
jgi:hypothetical protein